MFKEYWLRIPEKWRIEIVSASHTVISAMIIELLFQISSNGNLVPTEKTALVALGAAVLRSGQKAFFSFIGEQLKQKE